MPSNLDLLREGKPIEFRPGLSGRLNREKRALELSTGEVLDASDNQDLFPADENALKVSQHTESLEKDINGPVSEFWHQYSSSGIPGGIRDLFMYAGDDYIQKKQARERVSNRISEESPYISGAATVANVATDLALTRGMSAFKAAPLLTAGSAGSRLFTEPGEVLGESAMAAGGGYLLDKAGGWLGKVAGRRGEIRELPIKQENVRKANILGKQIVAEANRVQTEQFNALKQNVKNTNDTLLKQHEAELLTRKNKIIEAENAYKQAQASENATAQEIKRLNDEYKLAKNQYQESLKQLPEMQKRAQAEYSQNVVRQAESVANAFPKDAKIYSSQFIPGQFIEESIQKSGAAGTKAANQASRIVKALFPEGEILTAKELASRYKSLEGAIQKSGPEVQAILNDFKAHIGERLPTILADNMAYSRVIPTLQKQISKEVQSVISQMDLPEMGLASKSFLTKRAEANINQLFREITPEEFMQKFQSGEIRERILKSVMRPEDFSVSLEGLKSGKKAMKFSPQEAERLGLTIHDPIQQQYNAFSQVFSAKLDKALAKAEMKLIATDVDAAKKLGGKVKKTLGVAEPVQPPLPPAAPVLPSMPQAAVPPMTPPMPPKPSMLPEPNAPAQKVFTPQMEPTLSAPQGVAGRAGDFLEQDLLSGKGVLDNPVAKLAGLKYMLGPAALPLEAGYAGMKALTSPGAVGEVSRMTFKQGGIQAIESWLQKYPSYHDGIVEAPQERRAVTKEIEDASDIPIEMKAILQSKVNRGKPLSAAL